MEYYHKYIKYKKKYLWTKQLLQMGGDNGANKKIINNKSIKKFVVAPQKSYIKFNLNYSDIEKKSIDNIKINKSDIFNHYGLFNNISLDEIENFIKEIGNNDVNDCKIISNLLKNLCLEIQSNYPNYINACWLTIRVSLPNNNFKYPRWHLDGKFYDSKKMIENDIQSKFITSLKGPGTLITVTPDDIKEKLNKILLDKIDRTLPRVEIEQRIKIIELLEKFNKIQMNNNEGAIIIAFNNLDNPIKYRTIHSEPNITEPRIFISVLPGTIDEISELATRRNFTIK
jgi:hypothetical protein